MANKIPLKVIITEGDTSALSEFNPGDTVGIEFGGTGAATLTEAKDNLGISAIESELADKADQEDFSSHINNTNNPHLVTKAQVGLGNVDNTSDENKPISTATQSALNLKADLVSGIVPSSQLPSYVDDVLEYANLASFPATGESGKIYVALNTNKTYRWSGSAYTEISASPGSTDSVVEGSTNLYFTAARVRAVVLTGLSLATGTVIAATDTILAAFGKLQKQISNNLTTLTSHTANISNPHAVTKTQVGLGNADNTSDANKPISAATQTALDLKVSKTFNTGSALIPSGTTAQRDASPAEGYFRRNSELKQWEGYNGNGWSSIGQISGFKNRIINGDFNIWQRGASITIPVNSLAFTADRWYAYTEGSTINFTSGSQIVTGAWDSLQITGSAGNTFLSFGQKIEGTLSRIFQKEASVITFYVKSNVSKTIYHYIHHPSAMNDWSSSLIQFLSGSTILQANVVTPVTIAIPATINAYLGMRLELAFSSGLGAGEIINISQVQWESGSSPTSFEERFVGVELALCQRYYEKIGVGGIGASSTNPIAQQMSWNFAVPKRVIPIVTALSSFDIIITGISVYNVTPANFYQNQTTINNTLCSLTFGSSPPSSALIELYYSSTNNIAVSAEI